MSTKENTIPQHDILQAILDNPGTGIVVFDESFTIQFTNTVFASLVNHIPESLQGRKIDNFLPKDQHLKLHSLVKGKTTHARLSIHRKKKTNIILILDIASADKGNAKLFTGFTRELSKGKKNTYQAQKEVTDLKTQFLSVASHEFKMPVAGMISSLNLIRRYLKSADKEWKNFPHRQRIEKHLNNVNYSIRNLSDTMNKFLSLQNIESGKIRPHYESFNLLRFLKEHKAGMQNSHSTEVHLLYDCQACDTSIVTDKIFLNNILTNLVSNAIKYSQADQSVNVIARIEGNYLMLRVSDQGLGIPESEQEKIFDHFYRAENTKNHAGTGLGLTITKTYIDLLNGHISFYSEKDHGTTFDLNIPLNQ